MNKILAEVQEKLGKTYYDLEFMLNCFKEVLIEGGEGNLATFIPWINDVSKLKPENFTEKHVQLYSICFHLLNMVEENGAVQTRRKMEDVEFSKVNGLWGSNLKFLKEKGIGENDIAEMLPHMRIEPVLTAHPTEAKRSIVLEYHRNLYLLLVKRENSMYTEMEQKEIRKSIKLELDRLWRTGEIYLEKPDVKSELKSITHYLTTVFPEVIPIIDRRLIQAWEEVGFNPNTIKSHAKLPRIRFGDWVGGDRDGHPFVTADVTKHTLETLRIQALVIVRNNLKKLSQNLCFTAYLSQTNKTFQKRITELADELSQSETFALADNKREIFRVYVQFLTEKLPLDLDKDFEVSISTKQSGYKSSQELIKDLEILVDALTDFGANSIGYTDVRDVLRVVQTFGFHLAYLDIRQNSAFHDKALSQLMDAAMLDGKKFLEWDETERVKFINKELQSPRPFSQPTMKLGPEADAVTGCYRVVSKYIKNFTAEGMGSLIVSMTRSLSDLLVVYLLERESGLVIQTEDGLVSRLPVVPLFETIDDLHNSPEIMDAFLKHPFTKKSLEYHQKESGENMPVQQIMIGYSDSNKDGGIMASQWNLSLAQTKLTEIGKKHGVKIRFFHGKGGSISRGAGPTHWFIKTLPHGSIHGDLRLTEQGETIAQKYANVINAAFNIELLIAGTSASTIHDKFIPKVKDKFEESLEFLANESQKHYQALITDKNFIQFFSQATPIDVIENSKIGSRPSRRTGKRSIADLRAIPWVFSWSQSRFNITSWYGVGSTLEEFYQQKPHEFEELAKFTQQDTLARYVFTNVDTSLAATDEEIFTAYADLVEDEKVKAEILGKIRSELHKTEKMLGILFKKPFEERRKYHHYSNSIRATALNDIHFTQIGLLKKWRKAKEKDPESEEAQSVLLQLLLTVNAIASALRITG